MPSPLKPCKRARPLLGTLVEITAFSEDQRLLDAAINAAFAAVSEVHLRMSAHEATSDLAALHSAPVGALVRASAHSIAVLRTALEFARQSQGAFNPCLGGPMSRLGHLPADDSPHSTDYTALEIVGDQQLRRHAPLRLDLGGIAKGYAVDLAVARLQAAGIELGVVNAGGDLRCFGETAETIGIRDPQRPQQMAQTISLQNRAMATSAPYFSPAHRPSALYDPARQQSHSGAFSISVLSPSCMTADALTKVALNAPAALAAQLLAQHQAEAIWLGAPDAPQ